jgi:ATP-dependent RNA helicase DDX56/DBP9
LNLLLSVESKVRKKRQIWYIKRNIKKRFSIQQSPPFINDQRELSIRREKEKMATPNSLFDQEVTWAQNTFQLDRRLVKGVLRMGFTYPTLVQSKSIPLALEGKDMLIRARTGSGKTVAFALPIMNKVLSLNGNNKSNNIKAVVLAPTKELVKQIEKVINDLTYYCKDFLSFYAIHDDNQKLIDFHIQNYPDILVSTPAKLVTQLEKKKIDLSTVNMVIVDEADLILSYGYKQDINTILSHLPKIFQGIFLSATLSAELEKFKKLVLHNPVILKLEEEKSKGNLVQFFLECSDDDKFLILYVFLKLGLLQGKGLIFVNDVNKCYRLKLFLQQFFISSAVLNAEVPVNSRTHIIEEYNHGIFNYLIASDAAVDKGGDDDESSDEEEEEEEQEDEEDDEDEEEENDDEEEEQQKRKKNNKANNKKSHRKQQGKFVEKDEYGVSRGIDFQGVNFVINFDFPKTASAYIHRIGRTARGVQQGTAISFVTKYNDAKPDAKENTTSDRDYLILKEVRQRQPRLEFIEGDNIFATMGAIPSNNNNNDTDNNNNNGMKEDETRMQPTPLVFNARELDPFRYRVEDTLRSVTGAAVREFRGAEIRREILNSEKLKSYFVENPNDLKVKEI